MSTIFSHSPPRRGTLGLLVILAALAGMAGLPALAQQAPATSKAAPFETEAKQAILFDFDTGSVLFEREADAKLTPASLVKIMSAVVVFRELREGRLKMDGDMVVSTDAWRRGGAVSGNPNMLLTPNRVLKVGELINGLVITGANDAAIALAENIAGREARFVEMMNAQAGELGLKSLEFRNATGLAQEGQAGSLRDFVALSAHLIRTYPGYYPLFSQREMVLGTRGKIQNRNPLLGMEIGADGVMTGNLPENYMLVGSAVQEGRRLIVAVAGLESAQERALEARKLLEWGFRRFEIKTLFPAGTVLSDVSLYGGAAGSVAVKAAQDIRLPVLRGTHDGTTLRIAYRGPVAAPVAEGAPIARLQVLLDGRVIQEAPLVAARSVALGGTLDRARDASFELLRQWSKNGFAWLYGKTGLAGKKT